MGSTLRVPFEDASDCDDILLESTVEEGDFNAEKICSEVPTQDPNEKHYLVKWEEWPIQASTIEPFENLKGCVVLLAEWETEKALIKAGKKAEFDLDAWYVMNRAHLDEKAKRKARRERKRRKIGLAPAAPDGSSDGLSLDKNYPYSEADDPAPLKRQKTTRVKRKGVAQVIKKSQNPVAVEISSGEESSDDSMDQASSDDRGSLMDEVNGRVAVGNTREALPDRSSHQLNQDTATANPPAASASKSSKPAAGTIKKRKVTQPNVSRTDVLHSTTASKPHNGAAASGTSATILSTENTEPKKKPLAKRTASISKPVNIFSNWTDSKAKPRNIARVNGETPKDSSEPTFNKLSTQYKYQRYGVNEPPPNPDAIGTFNPSTGRIEPAKGPDFTAAAPVRATITPLPSRGLPADVSSEKYLTHDAGKSAQASQVQKPTPSMPFPPAPMIQNSEFARPTRQISPPAPRLDDTSVFGRRLPPHQARERTPSPPAPTFRDYRPHNAYTKTCERWKAGYCGFGDRCHFAHTNNLADGRRPLGVTDSVVPSLAEKHRIECLYWNRGRCDKTDDVCKFAHHVTGFYVEHARAKRVMVRSNVETSRGQRAGPRREGAQGLGSDGEILEDDAPLDHGTAATNASPPPPPLVIPKSYQGDLITCHYWRTSGTCNRGNSCYFAHYDTVFYIETPGSKVVLQTAQAIPPHHEEVEPASFGRTPLADETVTSENAVMGNGDYLGNGVTASPIHASPAEFSSSQPIMLSMRINGKNTGDFFASFAFTTKQDGTMFAEVTRSAKKMEMTKIINAGDLQYYLKDILQQDSRWPTGGLVADNDIFAKFAEACRLHASCGVVSTREYTVLFFPSGLEDWNFLASRHAGAHTSTALQFKLLPPLPAQCQTPNADKIRELSISSKDTSQTLSGRYIFNLHTDRMLVTSDGKINVVFIMMPLSRDAEIEALTKLFEAKGCKVLDNRKPGAWDHFRRDQQEYYKKFLLLVDPEVPLKSIPRLGLIVAAGTMRAFSIGANTKALEESSPPSFDCRVLFPHGEVVLIPDDMFYLQPQNATKILKTAAEINARQPKDADHATRLKVATRPGIREWLHQLVVEKSQDRGRHDPRWADQFQALCELYNDSTRVPGDPLASSDIIEASLLGYNDLKPGEATNLLVTWFGIWSEHYATDYRRFSVCNFDLMEDAVDPRSWGTTYNHIAILSPTEWLDRQRKLQPSKK